LQTRAIIKLRLFDYQIYYVCIDKVALTFRTLAKLANAAREALEAAGR